MRVRRLRWFGHIERKEKNCWLREVQNLEAPGKSLPGRPPNTWSEVINDDQKAKGLAPELALNRDSSDKPFHGNSLTHATWKTDFKR